MSLTIERLREVLSYDPTTGEFRWLVSTARRIKVGDRAGMNMPIGYRSIRIDRQAYYEHRLAWFYVTGSWPENQIDHIDLNYTNNAFNNLRPATAAENKLNRKAYSNNKVGLKGVCFSKGKYQATIRYNNKQHFLGYFSTPEEAHAAYCKAANDLHKDFARTT